VQNLRWKVSHLRKRDGATEEVGAAIQEQPPCHVGAGRVAEVREVDREYRVDASGVSRRNDAEITKAAVDALSSDCFRGSRSDRRRRSERASDSVGCEPSHSTISSLPLARFAAKKVVGPHRFWFMGSGATDSGDSFPSGCSTGPLNYEINISVSVSLGGSWVVGQHRLRTDPA
jgi:hypothetical protein